MKRILIGLFLLLAAVSISTENAYADGYTVGSLYSAQDNLNMRSSPNVKAPKTGLIPKGNTITLVEIGQTVLIDGIRAPWVRVRLQDGTEGWCFAGYLDNTKTQKTKRRIIYEAFKGYRREYTFTLTNDEIATLENSFYTRDVPPFLQVAPYTISYEHKIPFICNSAGEKIFLILKSPEVCFLFVNHNHPDYLDIIHYVFGGLEQSQRAQYKLSDRLTLAYMRTSSFLMSENKATGTYTDYDQRNLIEFLLDAPWIEGVRGHGIGEQIRFSTYGENEDGVPFGKTVGFYVCNGFISFQNPELYEKTSRVKEFKVTDQKTKKSKAVYLDDTPNPQFIDISEFEGTDVELEITDVYPGTERQDTCVAGIVLKRLRK